VIRWVTTGEYPPLYVFVGFCSSGRLGGEEGGRAFCYDDCFWETGTVVQERGVL
jgi:hypothetical protein